MSDGLVGIGIFLYRKDGTRRQKLSWFIDEAFVELMFLLAGLIILLMCFGFKLSIVFPSSGLIVWFIGLMAVMLSLVGTP